MMFKNEDRSAIVKDVVVLNCNVGKFIKNSLLAIDKTWLKSLFECCSFDYWVFSSEEGYTRPYSFLRLGFCPTSKIYLFNLVSRIRTILLSC